MSDLADLARRVDCVDGGVVIDYFFIYLPVQLISIDVIGIEKRSTPAITEFCLKAIRSGLNDERSISGFLGVAESYGSRLLENLRSENYLARDALGNYSLMRRALEILKKGSSDSPSDRRIQVLWDPVRKMLLDRTIVYTRQRLDRSGIIAPIPGAFSAPQVSDIVPAEINKIRGSSAPDENSEGRNFEVLRATAISKTFGRYRSVPALVQRGVEGELALRLINNGVVDSELTSAYANAGLLKLIGVHGTMATKPGVQAVKKRQSEIICKNVANLNVGRMVQRRSVLSFNVRAIDLRLAEEQVDSLVAKRQGYIEELNKINEELSSLAIVPVRCYEVDYYLKLALERATKSIVVTSTNVSPAKFDGEMLRSLRSCLDRGVEVLILISDRIKDDDAMLAIMDRMVREAGLRIRYLINDARSVFEIFWDDNNLLVSNEPPMGDRRGPPVPREFTGFYLTDHSAVDRYRLSHLMFEEKDFLTRIVARPSGGARGVGKRASSSKPKSSWKNRANG